MRRIACVALPEIRVELAHLHPSHASALPQGKPEQAPGPLAVVVARPGGAVKTERDVLGSTRLDVVSRQARAEGVRAGQTVAAARARCAELRVRVVVEAAVRSALERVAEAAMAFGPAVALDVARDVVWVDVSGCAHLHGGEARLTRSLAARVQALGHVTRVALADGPRLAEAVARFADPRAAGPLVVREGQGAAAMRVLPVAALGLDEGVTSWLRDLGLTRCGDLQKLPRRSLGTRLGPRTHDVMQLLGGDDRAPLDAWRPPEVPEERIELDWGATSIEALSFVLKTLCDRLAARLQGRAMAAARLEVVLALDRALCPEATPPFSKLEIVLPIPLAAAGELLGVVRARLERHELAAPVLATTLRASELARSTARTLDLLEPEPVADRALPRLVAELSAELGPSQVGLLELVDTWAPDERTRLVPFGLAAAGAGAPGRAARAGRLTTSTLEPSRLAPSRPLERAELSGVRTLARIEAVEWWRRAPGRRDLAAAWVAGRREGALAWVELMDAGGATLLGWID